MENVPEDGEESAMPFHYMGRHKWQKMSEDTIKLFNFFRWVCLTPDWIEHQHLQSEYQFSPQAFIWILKGEECLDYTNKKFQKKKQVNIMHKLWAIIAWNQP